MNAYLKTKTKVCAFILNEKLSSFYYCALTMIFITLHWQWIIELCLFCVFNVYKPRAPHKIQYRNLQIPQQQYPYKVFTLEIFFCILMYSLIHDIINSISNQFLLQKVKINVLKTVRNAIKSYLVILLVFWSIYKCI